MVSIYYQLRSFTFQTETFATKCTHLTGQPTTFEKLDFSIFLAQFEYIFYPYVK